MEIILGVKTLLMVKENTLKFTAPPMLRDFP
jgi:hypothetical protein